MYQRILLGTDGSPDSRRATAAAANVARALGADLTVIAVAVEHGQPAMPWSNEGTERPVRSDVARRWARDEATWLAEQGIPADVLVEEGHAAEALAKAATTGRFDLLVVGHRGRTGGQAPGAGSVVAELIDLAPCPLFVVP